MRSAGPPPLARGPGARRGALGGESCAGSRGALVRVVRARVPARPGAPGPPCPASRVPRRPAFGEVRRFTLRPAPGAGVTLRGCCEYFHLLPPTCRNLSLECLGRRDEKRRRRPGWSVRTPAARRAARAFRGEDWSSAGRGGQGGGFSFLLRYWELQTCSKHAAPLSLASKPADGTNGVFVLMTEIVIPTSDPAVFIWNRWAPL